MGEAVQDLICRGQKIRLCPNKTQEKYFYECCGMARIAYNWCVKEYDRLMKLRDDNPNEYGYPNVNDIMKRYNVMKKTEYPYKYEIDNKLTCLASDRATYYFSKAVDKHIKSLLPDYKGDIVESPVMKNRNQSKSFTVSFSKNQVFVRDRVGSNKQEIWVPKLGWVKMGERLRFNGRLGTRVTISRKADSWYASFKTFVPPPDKLPVLDTSIGVDVGTREYALSTGEIIPLPRPYFKAQERLALLQRKLDLKQSKGYDFQGNHVGESGKYGSMNYRKLNKRIERLYAKTSRQRQYFLHNLTCDIIRNNQVIGIENLDVKKMLKQNSEKNKNTRVAKSKNISDACFGTFKQFMQYKSELYGRDLVLAPKNFASTLTCSNCLTKNSKENLNINTRSWVCPNCGADLHRDVNAAINLQQYARELIPLVPSKGKP